MVTEELIALRRNKIYVESIETNNDELLKKKVLSAKLIDNLGPYGSFRIKDEVLEFISVQALENHINQTCLLPMASFQNKEYIPLWPNYYKKFQDNYEEDDFLSSDLYREIERIKNLEDTIDLGLMTKQDLVEIGKNIMSSTNSIDKEKREELIWILNNIDLELPDDIPFKEIQCLVADQRPDYDKFNSINDILRLGIYKLGGSVTLSNVPKKIKLNTWHRSKSVNPEWRNLKSLPRSERKKLLERIEKLLIKKNNLYLSIVDAIQKRGAWLLLSERLHPGDYYKQFPKTCEFFKQLKSKDVKKNNRTWNYELQMLYRKLYQNEIKIGDITNFISHRPGELVRRLDSLIRRCKSEEDLSSVIEIFQKTSGMRSKVLIELAEHLGRRTKETTRFITLKNGTKQFLEPNKPIPKSLERTLSNIILEKIKLNISEKIEEKDLVGKIVYLQRNINKIPIPVNMRNAMSSVPKNIKTSIPKDDSFIRFYLCWTQEPNKEEDLDLHAYLYKSPTEGYNIGFNTGFHRDNVASHSGDVRFVPGQCAEFVDINIPEAINKGYKYISFACNNYQGRGLNTLPCFAGFESLNSLERGKTELSSWVPSNLSNSIPLDCDSSNVALMLVDLEKREVIYIDCPNSELPIGKNNDNEVSAIINYYISEVEYNCYDVLKYHYESRGAIIMEDIELTDEVKSELYLPIHMEITSRDIVADYTKVLSIL